MADKLKINAGCGANLREGFINADKFPEAEGVEKIDFEAPLPWEDGSVDEMEFIHSMEHMGRDPDVFLSLMKEIYRVCCDGATVRVHAPHVMHMEFWGDPTHCRPISADMFLLFSKKVNEEVRKQGGSNSCFALRLGVDFDVLENQMVLDPRFEYIKEDPNWARFCSMNTNTIREVRILLKVNKPNAV